MRILHVSRMFPRPGKETSGIFVLGQVKSLFDQGLSVEVVSPRPTQVLSRRASGSWSQGSTGVTSAEIDGVPVTYLEYTHVPLRLSTRFEVWSLVKRLGGLLLEEHRREPVTVLHAHQIFPVGYVTAVLGRRMGIPVVCTAHGSDVHTHPFRNRGIARYTRAALRMIDRVVAVSQDLATRILTMEARAAVEVIYNGIDPAVFRPIGDPVALRGRLGLPLEGIGICTVSRLAAAKGIPELARALKNISESRSDVWAVIIGDGPMREELLSLRDRMAGRLILTGPLPHREVSAYLNASDLFCLPSHNEGVPVSMLEAMACGLPVIATEVGGIPEVVVDGETGLLSPARDEKHLASNILRLVENGTLRREMGSAAAKLVHSRYTWEQSASRLRALYGEITRSRALQPSTNVNAGLHDPC